MAREYTWSAERPKRPDVDPIYKELADELRADKRSLYAKANISGLSPATIQNWEKGKVRRPQGASMQMAAKALGMRIALIRDKEKK